MVDKDSIGSWVFGAILGVLALLGLLFASRAQDPAFYLFGLLLFVFGVAMIFGLITRGSRPHGFL